MSLTEQIVDAIETMAAEYEPRYGDDFRRLAKVEVNSYAMREISGEADSTHGFIAAKPWPFPSLLAEMATKVGEIAGIDLSYNPKLDKPWDDDPRFRVVFNEPHS